MINKAKSLESIYKRVETGLYQWMGIPVANKQGDDEYKDITISLDRLR